MKEEQWICEYIENSVFKSVNMLDEEFVNGFIEKFNCEYKVTMIGAYRCSKLSRLLGKMYKKGILKRFSMGLSDGAWQDGFPKWIYNYEMSSMCSEILKDEYNII